MVENKDYKTFQQKKVEGMKLGQAMKQATETLKPLNIPFWDEYEKKYKKTVKNIYRWNQEIEKEVLGE